MAYWKLSGDMGKHTGLLNGVYRLKAGVVVINDDLEPDGSRVLREFYGATEVTAESAAADAQAALEAQTALDVQAALDAQTAAEALDAKDTAAADAKAHTLTQEALDKAVASITDGTNTLEYTVNNMSTFFNVDAVKLEATLTKMLETKPE